MQLNIEKNQKEIKQHGTFGFPVSVSRESIQSYEQGGFLWHWHPEIELTLFTEGHMEYRINDRIYCVQAGEGLFGNTNTLHAGFQQAHSTCSYISITFHPRFLYGYEGSLLQTRYISPLTEDLSFSSLHLKEDGGSLSRILSLMREVISEYDTNSEDTPLNLHLLLTQLWGELYHYYNSNATKERKTDKNLARLRRILTYLQEHYTENLTLDEISAHVNICTSECCRFFKKYMNMTIFEYLMFLRIENSLPMLRNGSSITDTATACGFTTSSYYGQIFHRYMHCTPSEYKKRGPKPN